MPDNPISPSGRIRDVRLPTLLQFLRRERKTGILTLRRNDLHKFIYLQEGDIVFASSLYQDDRLGEMLLKAGKIKFDQYEKSVDLLKKTGKRQGTILVEEGMITPKDLFEGVLFQVKEIIASLFTWIDGEYAFDEGPLSSEDVITINMSTANLILEGVRRINDWTRLMNDLPPLNHVLQVATDPRDLFQTMNMTSMERDVMRQVDGRRSLRDIL
ncbi:MAG TPA: DUF4388 domain-containing protein, partial [Candidatus Manganitrophaceae bacterium]|nr:DUF4388 domain-containing protein [Candidatus Manganitrophaceae bacterium]